MVIQQEVATAMSNVRLILLPSQPVLCAQHASITEMNVAVQRRAAIRLVQTVQASHVVVTLLPSLLVRLVPHVTTMAQTAVFLKHAVTRLVQTAAASHAVLHMQQNLPPQRVLPV